jgi:hypothetical protein
LVVKSCSDLKATSFPADRLISENLAARQATVTTVQGKASKQTIVIFTSKVEEHAPR